MSTERSLTEPVLNALLRRVDWRFLLPCPRPRFVACFAGGQLSEAVTLMADRITDSHVQAKGQCDLTVMDAPDSTKIRHAWQSLAEGGYFYGEWARPQLGGMSAVKDELIREGFTDVTLYWAWPAPERGSPNFWLPIQHTGAISYFFAHRPASRSRLAMMKRKAYQFAWRIALRSGMTFPLSVIARKPAQKSLPAEHKPKEGRLLLTGGHRSINKVVTLVFNENASHPQTAVKWARVPQAHEALRREAAMLKAVHALRPDGMPGIPRVVFSNLEEERACAYSLGETVLEGEALSLQVNRHNLRRLSLQTAEWLVNLASDRTTSSPAVTREIVESALNDFKHSFGPVVSDSFVSRLRVILEALPELPRVCEHRDFSPWNVLLNKEGDIVVLDWESAVMDGMPALDLIYMLTYLAFFIDGAMESGRYRESYRRLLTDNTFTGRVFDESMSHYAFRMHIDLDALQPLRVLTWLIHARSEYSRITDDTLEKTPTKNLQHSMFISLLEEEIAMYDEMRLCVSEHAFTRRG